MRARLATALGLLAAVSLSAHAAPLAQVQTDTTSAGAQIRVSFTAPMLYLSHAPAQRADTLTIWLKPVSAGRGLDWLPFERSQTLSHDAGGAVPLREVRYEDGGGAGPHLVLAFTRPVRYRVRGASRGDAVIVALSNEVDEAQQPQAAAATSGSGHLAGRYVITLRSSAVAVHDWQVPRRPVYQRYRLYSQTTTIDGKRWQRLRLGFFTSAQSARTVLGEVSPDYPGAWVARATVDEKRASANSIVRPRTGGSAPPAGRVRALAPPGPRDTAQRTLPRAPSARPAETNASLAQSADRAAAQRVQGLYALDLMVSSTWPDARELPYFAALQKYQLYVARARTTNAQAYHLRLGFFASDSEARTMADALRTAFPRVRVVRVSERERAAAFNAALQPEPASASPARGAREPARAERLHAEARKAMTARDYPRAVQLLTALLQEPDHEYLREAQELLGLAHERNGRAAHAKAEYETYLQRYPEGEDADRVRQRLAGLVTASRVPAASSGGVQSDLPRPRWDWLGTVSQFYWHDADYADDEEVLNLSELSSYAFVAARRRSADYDLRTQVAIDNRYDLIDEDDESRVLEAYVDALDRRHNVFGRFGRQLRRGGGVFARFDGAYGGYRLSDSLAVNAVAGRPVESFDTGLDVERNFLGFGLDIGTLAERWDLDLYVIEQHADGILDRRAIGAELRYFDANRSLIGLLDYDLSYEKRNIAFLHATWTSVRGHSLHASFDERASPLLTTTSALLGQTAASLEALSATFSEDEIRQLALDRTADSRTFNLGGSWRIRRNLRLDGNLTLARLDATEASTGVPANPPSEDTYYTLQLIRDELFFAADAAVLGLRYADAQASDAYAVSARLRIPARQAWRLTPAVQLEHRESKTSDNRRSTLEVSFAADYHLRRRVRLHAELGARWASEEIVGQQHETPGVSANLGYYWDFD